MSTDDASSHMNNIWQTDFTNNIMNVANLQDCFIIVFKYQMCVEASSAECYEGIWGQWYVVWVDMYSRRIFVLKLICQCFQVEL